MFPFGSQVQADVLSNKHVFLCTSKSFTTSGPTGSDYWHLSDKLMTLKKAVVWTLHQPTLPDRSPLLRLVPPSRFSLLRYQTCLHLVPVCNSCCSPPWDHPIGHRAHLSSPSLLTRRRHSTFCGSFLWRVLCEMLKKYIRVSVILSVPKNWRANVC
jgi:hypothetical protein